MKVRLPAGASRAPPRKKRAHEAGPLRCPTCGSADFVPELAGLIGARYHCKACGFRGALAVSGLQPPAAPPKEGSP